MNILFLSPHFPPNYYRFCLRLKELGATVLAIADEPFDRLRPELRQALTEYRQVENMEDYDQLMRACGYFTYRYGKMDRIESLNEHWLAAEARLRTDFNVPGIKNEDIAKIKRKSEMKKVFRSAGIPVARGGIIPTIEEARQWIAKLGYPVVVKPDIGVGSAKTYRLESDRDLVRFFSEKPPVDYVLEEYIGGTIHSFDGITAKDGRLLFVASHVYSQGVMETVNENRHVSFYSVRQIPDDLMELGLRTLQAFDVRERFFHFEFFRTGDGSLVALEVNMRPPGGLTLDMFNFANDIDIYRLWAQLLLDPYVTFTYERKYYCAYVGRRLSNTYVYSHKEVLTRLGDLLCHHERLSPIFQLAMGDYSYLVRSSELAELREAIDVILAVR
ncbi:ATP-grasp domain-containing protein [Heliobacterium chlorum]|uniref:ATP-grasp domain-containing protein n=1 Tax=Heliobacterium chlorum TaxID=2698 RepID=A0ABR7T1H5_HELCL|nr:ATP-grasp domain-containing protein [Heliobacterium chlorum]MBC9784633.1 ATP-grasp domain-containing protein [Heliobacterium chlorum]